VKNAVSTDTAPKAIGPYSQAIRAGELLFGAVTHERYAFLRLPEAEWKQWNATAER